MARILVTNFHSRGGGGHIPYIEALTRTPEHSPHIVGVAVPETCRTYKYLTEAGYPHLYACNFPSKIQKELPSIIRSIKVFRKIIEDFKPEIVHVNGGG